MIQEAFGEFDVPWRNDLVCGWNPLKNGEFVLSDSPGLGLELDESTIESHPYVPNAFPSLWDSDWQTKFTQNRVTSRAALRDLSSRTDRRLSQRVGCPCLRRCRLEPARGRAVRASSFSGRPGPAAGRPRLLVAALLAGNHGRAHPRRRRSDRVAALGEASRICQRSRAPGRHRPLGAGYDKIDLAACTEHGVAVFNAPLALNHSTASAALLFMLALAKRLPEQERLVRDRAAGTGRPRCWAARSLGRTVGIIGLGS